jgi:hypothetical protein
MSTEHFLNDIWNLYFHDPYDSNWTNASYVRLATMSTIDEFWEHFISLKGNLHKGMFFIMREYVFPCWDDENNINGGCLSIKVLKENMAEFFEDLCAKLLSEKLLSDNKIDFWNSVNGVSTSPKKSFCIIKIWLKDEVLNDKKFFNLNPNYYGDIIYKSNRENITGGHVTK